MARRNGLGELPRPGAARGGRGVEFLAIQTKSPCTDVRPLLVAGQAEVREFRARFWDDGQPNGDWCDVAKVTVSP